LVFFACGHSAQLRAEDIEMTILYPLKYWVSALFLRAQNQLTRLQSKLYLYYGYNHVDVSAVSKLVTTT
jgi:hypothetical protein